jgi:hypothetical protein
LPAERQAALRARLTAMIRTNTYDPATARVTISPERARAFTANATYYADVFRNGRNEYAIPAGALTDPARARQLSAFFFWSAWAASTNRPGDTVTYTSNWPHEPLIDNRPTGEAGRLDGRQHHRAAGGHRSDGVVARVAKRGRAARRRPRRRSVAPIDAARCTTCRV